MGQPIFAPQMLRKDVRGELIESEMVARSPYLYERIATIMQSTSDRESYAWLSAPSDMREFVTGMNMSVLTDTGLTPQTGSTGPGYEIANKTWAGALLFGRDAMADEKINGFQVRIQDQVAAAHAFPDYLLVQKLVAGETDTCYLQVGATGEAFFSATHAARGDQTATWSNIVTGTGSAVANISTDIGSAISYLYNMTNEANRPMNRFYKQLFVMFAPAIEVQVRTAVLAGIVSSTSNVSFAPDIELISEPLLTVLDGTNTDDYYVGIKDAPIRGLIWQEREGVMSEEIGAGSEMWTNERQTEFAVTRRGNAGYGRPQRMVKVKQ